MIISFKCKYTEKLAGGVRVRQFVNFERIALRKLRQLQAASRLDDLKVPPGNMLEALSHVVKGSIVFESTNSFASAFAGPKLVRRMLKLLTTIRR